MRCHQVDACDVLLMEPESHLVKSNLNFHHCAKHSRSPQEHEETIETTGEPLVVTQEIKMGPIVARSTRSRVAQAGQKGHRKGSRVGQRWRGDTINSFSNTPLYSPHPDLNPVSLGC